MNNELLQMLQKTGAVNLKNHFVYTSGKHGRVYVNKDALYPHTEYVSRVAEIIAQKYKTQNIDVVAGPSLGGIILSQWVAYHLSKLKNKEILSVYTVKMPDKNQVFTRGYEKLVKGI